MFVTLGEKKRFQNALSKWDESFYFKGDPPFNKPNKTSVRIVSQ